jgi:hypothetical protein
MYISNSLGPRSPPLVHAHAVLKNEEGLGVFIT